MSPSEEDSGAASVKGVILGLKPENVVVKQTCVVQIIINFEIFI